MRPSGTSAAGWQGTQPAYCLRGPRPARQLAVQPLLAPQLQHATGCLPERQNLQQASSALGTVSSGAQSRLLRQPAAPTELRPTVLQDHPGNGSGTPAPPRHSARRRGRLRVAVDVDEGVVPAPPSSAAGRRRSQGDSRISATQYWGASSTASISLRSRSTAWNLTSATMRCTSSQRSGPCLPLRADLSVQIQGLTCTHPLQIWNCSKDESNRIVHQFFKSHHFAVGILPIPGALPCRFPGAAHILRLPASSQP